jgi:rfaE bifunctional protein kinase chain/domain
MQRLQEPPFVGESLAPVSLFRRIEQVRIGVVGDLMLDRYLHGDVERLCPEAPVPVVRLDLTLPSPGGAGNVAVNLRALGAACCLGGVIGEDAAGEALLECLRGHGIPCDGVVRAPRPTTEKTRVVANEQMIVRLDREETGPLDAATTAALHGRLAALAGGCDALVVSDYAKGVVTAALLDTLRARAREQRVPFLAALRPPQRAHAHDLTCVTLKRSELAAMVGHALPDRETAGEHALCLARELRSDVLVTLGLEGLIFADWRRGEREHVPAWAGRAFDVRGGGDALLAMLAAALAAGAEMTLAVSLANRAASLAVTSAATAVIWRDYLMSTFSNTRPHPPC